MRRAFQGDGIATGKVVRQLNHKEANVAGAEIIKKKRSRREGPRNNKGPTI